VSTRDRHKSAVHALPHISLSISDINPRSVWIRTLKRKWKRKKKRNKTMAVTKKEETE
jgi:hypothetical protein